jgi:hypothetical protein
VSVDIVNPAGRGVQWMLLDVPAARLPVLAWAQLGTSGQIDYAAPTIAAPVVFAPSKSLDSWLCTGTAPGALGNYKGVSVAGSQALGAGRALLLVAARLVTGDVYIEGTIRVELEAA